MVRVLALIAIAVMGCPTDSRAQTQFGPRFFVGAGIGAEADNTWGDEAPPPGIFIASGGVNVSRHVGIRVSLDVPKMFSAESQTTIGPLRTFSTQEHRTVGWSVLVDGHTLSTARVQVGLLGGVTFARHQSAITISTDQLGAGGAVVGHLDQTIADVFNWFGLTGGAELPVKLLSHLQIVPTATFTVFVPAESQGNTIVRGGVEARWQF